MKIFAALGASLALSLCNALSLDGPGGRARSIVHDVDRRSGPLQDLVTWDEHSLFIRGERAMMFSGEVHPFRTPVPSVYPDLFEKIKALGFNMVSFYVDWALLETKAGNFTAEGIFALEPFFEAAQQAGIYLLARPGPYINGELSGGGFPGRLQNLKGVLRSSATDYLNATNNYMANVCAIIAKAQITNGGPVVLMQPENEYTYVDNLPFPNGPYMQYVINQARNAGIVIPMINNDMNPNGNYAPGSGTGAMDIYGHDSYPVAFDCSHPSVWPANKLPTNFHQLHETQSPNTPYSLVEFQGGSLDNYGGPGFDSCAALTNHEFSRVQNKNMYASGVTIINLYMIWGGTNWGNLGHSGGYTSYDYGASIRENRVIDREKYSEVKLQAHFLRVSPSYLTTTVGSASTTAYSDNTGITITPLTGQNNTGRYFVARQTDYTATGSVSYHLKLPTSNGTLTLPQLGGTLSLHGRDSKIHLTDYLVGNYSLLYTTAEVFTWQQVGNQTFLVLYGGPNELHEFVVNNAGVNVKMVEGNVTSRVAGSSVIVQWNTTSERQSLHVGSLTILLLDRNSAYNYWVPLLGSSPYGTSLMNPDSVIVNGGYLVRSANVSGSTLSIRADFNVSTPLEIIGVPAGVTTLSVNGNQLSYTTTSLGTWKAQPSIKIPTLQLPSLSSLSWYKVDSLPELLPTFDDSKWPNASHPGVNSPTSLHGSEYGFYTGTLVFRGHFKASGKESKLSLQTCGGTAYTSSAWINGTYLGPFANTIAKAVTMNYTVANLTAGEPYTLTVVVDTMGLEQDGTPGADVMKQPHGIWNYALTAVDGTKTNITPWKVTGNLGGEDYVDRFRGPLNEGGLFFERQGYHYPSPPVNSFSAGSPYEGIDSAGITFYTAKLTLDLPADQYDVPLSFVFDSSAGAASYRAILYVNGFQFGKYVSAVGPQTEFPVPEGVLNYNGDNWVGLALWATENTGAKVPGFSLRAGTPVQTSRKAITLVNGPSYSQRSGSY